MRVEVSGDKMRQYAEYEQQIQENLYRLCGQLQNDRGQIKRALSSSSSESIDRILGQLCQSVSGVADSIGIMRHKLDIIVQMYDVTEGSISGERKKNTEVTKSGSKTTNEKEQENLKNLEEIISNINDLTENEGLATVEAIIGYMLSVSDLSNSEDLSEYIANTLGLSKESLGITKDLLNNIKDVINTYGTDSAKEWMDINKKEFGDAMDGIGDAESIVSFLQTVAQAYHDSGGSYSEWAKSVGQNSSALNSLSEVFYEDSTNSIALASLLGGGIYFSGEAYELSTDGHDMTWQEGGDLSLNTGLTMTKVGIEGMVGYVDSALDTNLSDYIVVDTDRAKGIFDKNIDWATDMINDTDMGMGGKVLTTIIASPVVAVWSIGEVFVDVGYQAGEKIKGGSSKGYSSGGGGGGSHGRVGGGGFRDSSGGGGFR